MSKLTAALHVLAKFNDHSPLFSPPGIRGTVTGITNPFMPSANSAYLKLLGKEQLAKDKSMALKRVRFHSECAAATAVAMDAEADQNTHWCGAKWKRGIDIEGARTAHIQPKREAPEAFKKQIRGRCEEAHEKQRHRLPRAVCR